jgi:hypothetical protein
MKLKIYTFTATEDDGPNPYTWKFNGYELPSGETLCPEEQTHDSFYASIDDVQAHGNASITDCEDTGRTVEYSQDEIRDAVRGSASEFGKSAIPKSLRHYLQ